MAFRSIRLIPPIASILTHWGRATHICVSKLIIIASDDGLSPGRRQAIIWNNAEILSIGIFGTKFSEILIEILIFSFKKMRLKVSSAKWRPFCRGLNVLKHVNSDICKIITRIWSKPSCYSILWSLMDSGSKVSHKYWWAFGSFSNIFAESAALISVR